MGVRQCTGARICGPQLARNPACAGERICGAIRKSWPLRRALAQQPLGLGSSACGSDSVVNQTAAEAAAKACAYPWRVNCTNPTVCGEADGFTRHAVEAAGKQPAAGWWEKKKNRREPEGSGGRTRRPAGQPKLRLHRSGLLSFSPCPSAHNPRPAWKSGAKESREGQIPAQGIERGAHRGGREGERRVPSGMHAMRKKPPYSLPN